MPSFEGIAIRPTKKHPFLIVGQSQASAYGESINSSTSGIRSLEEAIDGLADGGYVLDKRHLSWEVACEAISGPMAKVNLPSLTIGEPYSASQTFADFEEFFRYLEEGKARGDGVAFTYMSMDLYTQWWYRKGARVGRKIRGTVKYRPLYSGPLFASITA